jgi:hypothetical protein
MAVVSEKSVIAIITIDEIISNLNGITNAPLTNRRQSETLNKLNLKTVPRA